MSTTESAIEDLSRWSREILVGLRRNDRQMVVSDLIDITTVNERQNIHYRADEILEPRGLVEKERIESESSSLPRSRLHLTDEGAKAAAAVEEEWGSDDIDEAIRSLREGVEELESRVALLEGDGKGGAVSDLEDRLQQLESGLELTQLCEDDRHTLAEMRVGLSVIERTLIEDLDVEEEMAERVSEERERIYEEMDLDP